jgi:hypothetical protein
MGESCRATREGTLIYGPFSHKQNEIDGAPFINEMQSSQHQLMIWEFLNSHDHPKIEDKSTTT